MSPQFLRRAIAGVIAASALAAAGTHATADATASRQDADVIVETGAVSAGAPRRTTLTEKELNAYLTLDAIRDLPAGVVEPSVSIPGPSQISGRAVVDLDAVRKAQPPRSLLDPRRLLAGRVPITAAGTLQTGGGVARFSFVSAAAGSIPIPKAFLQEILSYYSRSPERPNGFNLDEPFALPSNIREIQVDRGQAIVIQ
jgi:hypothetical protein